MSNYPENADVFVDRTGSDNIASSDPNNAYDGIETTQGLLGALGKPQSWSTTLLTLLRKHQRGMRVEVVSNVLYARSGEAVLESTGGNKLAFRRNASDVTIGAGNIDVGSLAATFYYVYAKGDGAATTAPIVFSTDAYAPSGIGTAPYKLIGWFNNEAGGSLTPTFAGAWKDGNNEPNIVFTPEASVIGSISGASDFVTVPDMFISFISSGRPVRITAKFNTSTNSGGGGQRQGILEVDGTDKTRSLIVQHSDNSAGAVGGTNSGSSCEFIESLAAGAHVVQFKWNNAGDTSYIGLDRIMIVEEI